MGQGVWHLQRQESLQGSLSEGCSDASRHVGKEYAKFRRENGGSGTPSYRDPALAADAISRGYNKPQQRSQTPSGGKGGKSQKAV